MMFLGGNIWLAQRGQHLPEVATIQSRVVHSRPMPPRLVGRKLNLWKGELNLAWLLILLIGSTVVLLGLIGYTLQGALMPIF
jgi:hypothetical protein